MKNFTLIFILLCNPIFAQISTSPSGARNFELNSEGEEKINQVMLEAGKSFNEGLLSLQDNRRKIARNKFDEAVEVFLMSNINVKTNTKLNNCYNQMIETIYRIEFPSLQQPNVKGLAMTCGWSIKDELANNVVKILQTKPTETITASTEPNSTNVSQPNYQAVGFSDQKFELVGDEMAQLPPELIQEEIVSVETPSQRKQSAAKTTKLTTKAKPKATTKNAYTFIGDKPTPTKNGQYSLVIKYIYDKFDDPYSVKYLTWSEPIQVEYRGTKFWQIAVKLRAKNLFNAYRLTVVYFFIKQDRVVFSLDQSDGILSDVKELSYQKQSQVIY